MPRPELSILYHCVVCHALKLTFGEGQARLCQRCWPLTLAWIQITQDQRWAMAWLFRSVAEMSDAMMRVREAI